MRTTWNMCKWERQSTKRRKQKMLEHWNRFSCPQTKCTVLFCMQTKLSTWLWWIWIFFRWIFCLFISRADELYGSHLVLDNAFYSMMIWWHSLLFVAFACLYALFLFFSSSLCFAHSETNYICVTSCKFPFKIIPFPSWHLRRWRSHTDIDKIQNTS